ncbi:hypothetical protein ACFL04_01105 [Patescibacteria group bacterium]
MVKPEPLIEPDLSTNIVILRIALVVLSLILLTGIGYYAVYYINLLSSSPTEDSVTNPLAQYELVVRVRSAGDLTAVANENLLIEEYGQPISRNLISTTVRTNSVGTAVIKLPHGQYTIQPENTEEWSGLIAVNLFSTQELFLNLEPITNEQDINQPNN